MKEERLLILSMLKEGKINVEEATELLEALESNKTDSTNTKDKDFKDDKHKRLSHMTFEEIGSDIGNAISNMFDGLKDITGSFGFNFNSETITFDLEEDLSSIENPILDLKSINGSINLNKWQKDNISIKVTCEYKNGLLDNNVDFYKFYLEGDKLVFTPIFNKDISIKLDVFLPNKEYKEITLNTTNGRIQLQDINIDKLNAITTNGSININRVKGDEIYLSTKNGRIEALDISAEVIDLSTSNGRIICNHADINKATNVRLSTSNGSITSNLNGLVKGAYFDLDTFMGSVNLELPDMISINREQGFSGNKRIIAHNPNYDENGDNLQYNVSTSNGSIRIS